MMFIVMHMEVSITPWLSIETHGALGIPHLKKPSDIYV